MPKFQLQQPIVYRRTIKTTKHTHTFRTLRYDLMCCCDVFGKKRRLTAARLITALRVCEIGLLLAAVQLMYCPDGLREELSLVTATLPAT
jgi:hypothetical protein